jgi:hypothetical protein
MAFKSKEVTPYYNSVEEYVNSLPYDQPLDKFKGYVYKNPLKEIENGFRCGRHPSIVFKRLFLEDTYMIVSKEELHTLRTTIQYLPLALNDMHKKLCTFVKQCGFKPLSRRTEPYRWDNNVKFITTTFLRDDIRIILSSCTNAQEYVPNAIPILSMHRVFRNPETNRLKTSNNLASFAWIPVTDELGEQSRLSFEKFITKQTPKQ